ncbi:MAG: hypothetical protein ABIJ27_00920 [Candidatus Omnitrophota bacterium]
MTITVAAPLPVYAAKRPGRSYAAKNYGLSREPALNKAGRWISAIGKTDDEKKEINRRHRKKKIFNSAKKRAGREKKNMKEMIGNAQRDARERSKKTGTRREYRPREDYLSSPVVFSVDGK